MADVAHRTDPCFQGAIVSPPFPRKRRSQDQGVTPNVKAICSGRDSGERSAHITRSVCEFN